VRLTPTPSSVFQLTGLVEGKFDIAAKAIDNVIAYMEGQGEASVSVKPDLFVFMGGDNGLLSLAVQPEIKSYADLRGKTLSVDAMTTGYAFVLFDLLKRNGLNLGDYNVVKAGGVLERWERLRERQHDGTMLIAPFDILAKANGFNVLQYALDAYGPARSQMIHRLPRRAREPSASPQLPDIAEESHGDRFGPGAAPRSAARAGRARTTVPLQPLPR
jgi:ABC-type nitrate/sulfonate/bicarbonate transport system substrate-binding protein